MLPVVIIKDCLPICSVYLWHSPKLRMKWFHQNILKPQIKKIVDRRIWNKKTKQNCPKANHKREERKGSALFSGKENATSVKRLNLTRDSFDHLSRDVEREGWWSHVNWVCASASLCNMQLPWSFWELKKTKASLLFHLGARMHPAAAGPAP